MSEIMSEPKMISKMCDKYEDDLKFCEYEIMEDIGYNIDEMRRDIVKIVGECFNKHLKSSKVLLEFFDKHKMNKSDIREIVIDIMLPENYDLLIKKFKIEFTEMLINTINKNINENLDDLI